MPYSQTPIIKKLARPEESFDQLIFFWKRFEAGLIGYMPNLISAILIWLVGSWIIKKVVKILQKALTKRGFDISLESFLISICNLSLRILLIFTVAGQLGIQTTSFIAVLGAAGLAVGLALQGSLANFAGGVLILIFRPFKIDDLIEAQGQTGKVIDIQIFSTVLRMTNFKTVIIPNGLLSNGIIINNSRIGSLVFELKIEVDRGSDLVLIRKLLFDIMNKEIRILKQPIPAVEISGFGNGYFLLITGHTLVPDQAGVINTLNEKIWKVFAENKITGPESHTYVHAMEK